VTVFASFASNEHMNEDGNKTEKKNEPPRNGRFAPLPIYPAVK
jgi:hypothetical protein